jgi:MFS family permease
MVMAALIIPGGALWAAVDSRRLHLVTLAIYSVGTLVAGVSPSFAILFLGWSVVEGVAAALLLPTTYSIVVENYDGANRAKVFGAIGGMIEIASAYLRLQAGVERTVGPFVGGFMSVPPVGVDATDSVRRRPRTTRGGEPSVVRTAMTWSPMGPHWPGHSPPRETNESSPGVSPVPSECGLEPEDCDSPNPMVGFPRLQAREEVNAVGIAVGSMVGGMLTTYGSWRWGLVGEFFLMLVIVGLTYRCLPAKPSEESWGARLVRL